MGAKLEGMQQLMRQLAEAEQKVNKGTKEKTLKAGGEYLKNKIKPEVPVRTGNWQENIIVSEVKNGKVEVGADQQGDAFYGYMYEFGTSRQPARPVYGPVFENNKDNVQDEMAKVIKEDLGI